MYASLSLARLDARLTRRESRLARRETRGGNLLLSGTVHLFPFIKSPSPTKPIPVFLPLSLMEGRREEGISFDDLFRGPCNFSLEMSFY